MSRPNFEDSTADPLEVREIEMTEITEEMVERAAQAIHANSERIEVRGEGVMSYSEMHHYWIKIARAALEAAITTEKTQAEQA